MAATNAKQGKISDNYYGSILYSTLKHEKSRMVLFLEVYGCQRLCEIYGVRGSFIDERLSF